MVELVTLCPKRRRRHLQRVLQYLNVGLFARGGAWLLGPVEVPGPADILIVGVMAALGQLG